MKYTLKMNEITTIKITKETRERLNKLKEYERETFNDVVNKIFYVLNICKKSPEKSQKILNNIDKRIKRRQIMKKRMKRC
ncbi:hypothetical protein J4429_06045 [Candidatus Pacearchaeota archaeon]|nr:hypothetical protein [Candidatus Pacearchaeota archaeon]